MRRDLGLTGVHAWTIVVKTCSDYSYVGFATADWNAYGACIGKARKSWGIWFFGDETSTLLSGPSTFFHFAISGAARATHVPWVRISAVLHLKNRAQQLICSTRRRVERHPA